MSVRTYGSGLGGWQHSFSLSDMLRLGIRSLNLDVHADATSHIQVCHVAGKPCPIGSRPLAYALREIRDWLVANPQEVIFLHVQREWDASRTQEVASLFYNELTEEFLSRDELNALRGGQHPQFPSVDRIRAYGRQVSFDSNWPWWTDNGQSGIKNFRQSSEARQACEWKVLAPGERTVERCPVRHAEALRMPQAGCAAGLDAQHHPWKLEPGRRATGAGWWSSGQPRRRSASTP